MGLRRGSRIKLRIGFQTYIFADANVSDGSFTGIGLGHSFDPFNTKPEEEIIFESQDSEDSAIAALHFHYFPTCVYI